VRRGTARGGTAASSPHILRRPRLELRHRQVRRVPRPGARWRSRAAGARWSSRATGARRRSRAVSARRRSRATLLPHGAAAGRGTATRVEVGRRRGTTPSSRLLSQQWFELHAGSSSSAGSTADPPDPWPDRPGSEVVRLHLHLQLLLESHLRDPNGRRRRPQRRWAAGTSSGVFPRSMLIFLPSLPVSSPFARPPPSLSPPRGSIAFGSPQARRRPRGRNCSPTSGFAGGAVPLDAR
jgi:hypothetical protein